MPTGRYLWFEDRKEFLGIIYEGDEATAGTNAATILTVGCEATEEAIVRWLERALEKKPWIKGNEAVPDMYDRATRH